MNKYTFIKTIKAIRKFNESIILLEDNLPDFNDDELTKSFDAILTILFEDIEKLNMEKKSILFDYLFDIDKTITNDDELYDKIYK